MENNLDLVGPRGLDDGVIGNFTQAEQSEGISINTPTIDQFPILSLDWMDWVWVHPQIQARLIIWAWLTRPIWKKIQLLMKLVWMGMTERLLEKGGVVV